jgi:hypothetical protein
VIAAFSIHHRGDPDRFLHPEIAVETAVTDHTGATVA